MTRFVACLFLVLAALADDSLGQQTYTVRGLMEIDLRCVREAFVRIAVTTKAIPPPGSRLNTPEPVGPSRWRAVRK